MLYLISGYPSERGEINTDMCRHNALWKFFSRKDKRGLESGRYAANCRPDQEPLKWDARRALCFMRYRGMLEGYWCFTSWIVSKGHCLLWCNLQNLTQAQSDQHGDGHAVVLARLHMLSKPYQNPSRQDMPDFYSSSIYSTYFTHHSRERLRSQEDGRKYNRLVKSPSSFLLYSDRAGFATSPVLAPHEAVTYVRIVPEKRYLAKKCAPYGHSVAGDFGVDDPDGIAGVADLYTAIMRKYAHCMIPTYTYRPNSTAPACDPHMAYVMAWIISGGAQDLLDIGFDAVSDNEHLWCLLQAPNGHTLQCAPTADIFGFTHCMHFFESWFFVAWSKKLRRKALSRSIFNRGKHVTMHSRLALFMAADSHSP